MLFKLVTFERYSGERTERCEKIVFPGYVFVQIDDKRPCTVADADMIYCMKKRQICDRGNHSELMALNDEYVWVFNIQA